MPVRQRRTILLEYIMHKVLLLVQRVQRGGVIRLHIVFFGILFGNRWNHCHFDCRGSNCVCGEEKKTTN